MLAYIFFEILFLIIAMLNTRYSKIFVLIGILPVIFFLSFKEGYYYDFSNYVYMFETSDLSNITIYPEISYIFLSYLLKNIGLNFYWLQFLYYSLTFFFLFKGFSKLTKNIGVAFLYYILLPIFFLSQYITIRQALALSMFLFVVSLFVNNKKNWVIVFLVIFVSCTVHYSIIFAYMIFFMLYRIFIKKQHSMFLYLFLSMFSVIFSFYSKIIISAIIVPILKLFPESIPGYSAYLMNIETNIYRSLIYLLLYFSLLALYFYNKKSSTINTILINLFTIGTILTIIGGSDMNINRFANYYMIFLLPLLSNLIFYQNRFNKHLKYIIFTLYTILFSVYYYIGIYSKPDIFLEYKIILLNGLL